MSKQHKKEVYQNSDSKFIVHQYKTVKDASLISDDTLRPWLINKALNDEVQYELQNMDSTFAANSAQFTSSAIGNSSIDTVPQEFIELEGFLNNPGWINSENELDAMQTIVPETDAFQEKNEMDEDFQFNNESVIDDEIDEEPPIKYTMSTQRLSPSHFFNKRKGPKRRVGSASFMANPRLSPHVENRKTLDSDNMYGTLPADVASILVGPSAKLATMSDLRLRKAESLLKNLSQDSISKKVDEDFSSPLAVIDNTASPTNSLTLMLKNESKTSLDSPLKSASSPMVTVFNAHNNELAHGTTSNTYNPSINFDSLRSKASVDKAADKILAPSILPLLTHKPLSKEDKLARELYLSNGGNKTAPSALLQSGRSASELRYEDARPQTSSLEKLSISNSQGTTLGFGRQRLSRMRGVHSRLSNSTSLLSNPPKNYEASSWASDDDMARNVLLNKQTRERNKTDHTWSLLQTKGYLEIVGADNVFKSEMKCRHAVDDHFLQSLKKNSEDKTHFLRKDELMTWNDIAIRSNSKIFTSSGDGGSGSNKRNMKI